MRLRLAPLAGLTLSLLACGDDTTDPMDSGVTPDTGGFQVAEAGVQDGGGRPDSGVHPDAATPDPDLVFEGRRAISDLDFYVKVMGTTTSTMPPLVVLHTGPGPSHEYLPEHLRYLYRGRTVVFFDMRASGRSAFAGTDTTTITPTQDIQDLGWVVDWARRLDVTEKPTADLLGHGYGALIAALYAADHPSRVSRLALVAPYPLHVADHTAMRGEEQARFDSQDRTFFIRMQGAECLQNFSECFLQFWRRASPKAGCYENRQAVSSLLWAYGDFRAREFRERALRDSRFDYRARVGSISARTHIIATGTGSEPWPFGRLPHCDIIPTATSSTYQASIPSASMYRIQNSGHYPMVEQPGALRRELLSIFTYP